MNLGVSRFILPKKTSSSSIDATDGEAVNINEVKEASQNLKTKFVMNAERIDSYLNQL